MKNFLLIAALLLTANLTTGQVKISQMPAASSLTGDELVPIVQGGTSKRTTAQEIADLASGGSGPTYSPGHSIGITGDIIYLDTLSDAKKAATQGFVTRALGAYIPTPLWSNILSKPSSFPPSAHTHLQSEIIGLPDSLLDIRADLLGAGGGEVSSFNGRTGAVTPQTGDYTKSMVGLPNVDNTSDANKPVSTATQAALDLKADLAHMLDSLLAIHATKQVKDTFILDPLEYGYRPNDTSFEFGPIWDTAIAKAKQNHFVELKMPGGIAWTKRPLDTTQGRNCILCLPIWPDTLPRLHIKITGRGSYLRDGYNLPAPVDYEYKETGSTIIASRLTGQTYSGRIPSIIGGPTDTVAGSAWGFSNVYFEMEGVIIRQYEKDPTLTALDLRYAAPQVYLKGPFYAQTAYNGTLDTPTHPWAAGLLLPTTLNNALVKVDYACVIGFWLGQNAVAHEKAEEIFSYNCYAGIAPTTEGNGMHRAIIAGGGIEHCVYHVISGWDPATGIVNPSETNPIPLDLNISIEDAPTGYVFATKKHVVDPTSKLHGTLRFQRVKESSIIETTAGKAALLTTGGNNWEYVNVSAAAETEPDTSEVYFSHTFTGSDDALTSGASDSADAEAQLSGQWGRVGNAAYLVTTSTGVYANSWQAGHADGVYTCDINFTGGDAFLIFRVADDANYMLFEITNGGGSLFSKISGSYTSLDSYTQAQADGLYQLKVVANGGDITCYINDVEVMNYSGTTGLEAETGIGIGASNVSAGFNTGTTWDNLIMRALP